MQTRGRKWILTMALLCAAAARAQGTDAPQGPPGGHHGHHGPPPAEAIAACANLAADSVCSFTHEGKTLDGTCRAGPEGKPAACAPKGMGPGHPHGPPPEAIAACKDKASGAACSATVGPNGEHKIEGTCWAPEGKELACKPPHHGPPPEAIEACAKLTDGAACTVTHGDHTLSGTCRTPPEGQSLACAPAHPPHDGPGGQEGQVK